MKKMIILVIACCLTSLTYSQSYSETYAKLFLKNGSIINCNVVELFPGDKISVQTADGSLFVYELSEVLKVLPKDFGIPMKNASQEEESGIDEEAIISTNKENGFINITELGVYVGNTLEGAATTTNGTAQGIVFGIKNISGYQFNSYFSLGAGLGFKAHTGTGDYSLAHFSLDERIYFLKNKKITPHLSLSQGIGLVFDGGEVLDLEGNIGIKARLRGKSSIQVGLGYNVQYYNIAGTGRRTSYATAQYFTMNFSYIFRNPKN